MTLANPSYRFRLRFQRYFANPLYYQEGGPIFIYVGGDFEIGSFWLEHGHMHDIAADLHGYLFGSEMRYFGQNRPTSDVSTENLRFLSTEQALADMARLIDHIKQQDPRLTNAKVILVGAAFGGNLATWFSAEYPNRVDGIWSSSSFVEARMNFADYFVAIGDDLRNFGSNDCYRRTWRAFRTMESLIAGGRSAVLDEMFHLCQPIDSSNVFEIERFFESIAETVSAGIINGGYGYVHDLCEEVTNDQISNDLIAFAEWFIMEHRGGPCFSMSFQELVDFFSEPEWSSFGVITGRRQYLYLACREFGWFTTTDSAEQPFGSNINISYYVELCRQAFGDDITADIILANTERTNERFGGSEPNITNAFFTNGGLDPHRSINVRQNIGETVEEQTLQRKLP